MEGLLENGFARSRGGEAKVPPPAKEKMRDRGEPQKMTERGGKNRQGRPRQMRHVVLHEGISPSRT